MNLRDLRYFIRVAELSHFGRAAAACNVSQPTLSGQILKLEQELGVTLFERSGKSVGLTSAGAALLESARRAVAAAEDVVALAKLHRDPHTATLRLGVIPTLGPYLMPYLLPRIRDEMPILPLQLVEDLTVRLVEHVVAGKIDAAMIASATEERSLSEEVLFEDRFWLVLPGDHPLARNEEVLASDIDTTRLLLLQDGHCLRDQALELCGRRDLGDSTLADMRAASLETLLYMTAAGYGLTVLPQTALIRSNGLPAPLVARPLADRRAVRKVRLIFRNTSPRREVFEKLAALTRDSLPEDLGMFPNRRRRRALPPFA